MRKASRPDKVVPIMPPPLGDRRITAVATAKTSINGRDCGIIATTPSKRFGSCEGMLYQRGAPTWVQTLYGSTDASCQPLYRRKRNDPGGKGRQHCALQWQSSWSGRGPEEG